MATRQPCRRKPSPCRIRQPPEPPLKLKVVGLFKSSSFQVSKTIAETLKNNYPTRFEDPVIVPLQEFAWDEYLLEKKRELKGETWVYSSYVICFVNDQLLGNASDLKKWAQKVWDVVDIRPSALYQALTLDYATKFLQDTKHDFVYLDVCIDLALIGRMIFELFCDTCPKTCKNFQVLCTGTAGFSERGVKLHYKDSIFHRVVQNGWIQGGDIVEGRGDDGESIYGPTFEDWVPSHWMVPPYSERLFPVQSNLSGNLSWTLLELYFKVIQSPVKLATKIICRRKKSGVVLLKMWPRPSTSSVFCHM
ncbi:probable inactive peptidyl-prolyl cis-trans isomerase-like 6 isoform X2 [Meriones unguiculatus]|uniref:probable inactive peptidyl-prolyl cis-trans isomerase-like 6 isoform X2 n=1 Tax=Meriones unguiculatus TaxID=10047 RepID=UPI00293EA656|nr:probable inactive peptidyl-prolyl cis-trans isomerase-like 6 isoform X2 [Meriones unguiculatus]